MKSNNSWLKLNRSILESNVFDNPKLLKVWIWCLCKASHKAHDQVVGRQIQHLEPGQFVYGRRRATEELRLPESTTNNYMQVLKSNGNIDIKPNNKYSVVTVVNWAFYQSETNKGKHQNKQQTNNKRTTNEQQMDTNKNVKNVKKGKNDYSYLKQRREEIRKRSEKALEEIENEFSCSNRESDARS